MSNEARLISSLLDQLVTEHDPAGDRDEFMGAQFDLGLAWVRFSKGRVALA